MAEPAPRRAADRVADTVVELRRHFASWDAVRWLIILGVVLRLVRYLADRSLWLDEAMLAENLITYSLKQLLTRPMMSYQAAPVLYLVVERLTIVGLGSSEYAMRLPSLVAGLIALPMFASVARRFLPPRGAAVSMLLFAGVDSLVYYASEVKQYEWDVAVGLAIWWSTLRVIDAIAQDDFWPLIRTGCAWALIGAAAIFASHPACFFLAGAWGVAAVLAYRNSNRRTADRSTILPRAKLILGAVAALWGALVLTNYLVFLRPLTHINALQVDWASAFAPHDWQFFPWLAETCDSLFASYASLWIRPAFIPEVLAVFGLAVLWRRRPWQGALLVSPLLLALVACLLGKYPLSGRLALFTLPTLILLIAAGWDAAAAQSKWIGIALAVCVAAAPVGRSIFFSIRPEREEIRPLLAYLGTHRQAGDVLYCQRLSDIPLRYYTDRFDAGDDAYGLASMPKIVGQDDYTEADAMADLAPLKRVHGGVWVLITHPAALGGLDERVIFPKILGRWGRQIIRVEATNTALFRFEMQGG